MISEMIDQREKFNETSDGRFRRSRCSVGWSLYRLYEAKYYTVTCCIKELARRSPGSQPRNP